MAFPLFISFVILLRIGELILARKNERVLLRQGAVEYGQKHYPFIVMLHVLFILSLIIEYSLSKTESYNLFFLFLFFSLLSLKIWAILSLGKYWNTKIFRAPRHPLIVKGPYRYLKHPNYFIVIGEIAIIPLIFYLYYTAIIFTVLNAVMLAVRIKVEDKALQL